MKIVRRATSDKAHLYAHQIGPSTERNTVAGLTQRRS